MKYLCTFATKIQAAFEKVFIYIYLINIMHTLVYTLLFIYSCCVLNRLSVFVSIILKFHVSLYFQRSELAMATGNI